MKRSGRGLIYDSSRYFREGTAETHEGAAVAKEEAHRKTPERTMYCYAVRTNNLKGAM
jgi:hypothetical protein